MMKRQERHSTTWSVLKKKNIPFQQNHLGPREDRLKKKKLTNNSIQYTYVQNLTCYKRSFAALYAPKLV